MKSPRLPSRAARWSILAILLAAGLGGVIARFTADQSAKVIPAAYLVAVDDDITVRLRWKSRKLVTAITLPANAAVSLPAGKNVLVVYPDGRQERVAGPTRIQIPIPAASELDFLAAPLADLAPKAGDTGPVVDGGIRLTSPVGVTRFLNPTISWAAREGTHYDVALVDPADEAAPPRIARGVRPPLPFSALESKQGPLLPTDRIFAIMVRVAGDKGPGVGNQFLTAQDANADALPSKPADLLAEAVSALAHKPSRTGDAWMALSHLSEPWKHCELAVRLRLKVSTELLLTDEIQRLSKELGSVN